VVSRYTVEERIIGWEEEKKVARWKERKKGK
jgi:hypothetical protein